MIIDVQFNATKVPWPQVRDGAVAAETAGFGAVWVFDHLAGMALGGTTALEPFTLLGALAASTTTVALGTLVLNVFNRQPAVVAVGAASVAAIGRRLVLVGVGAGSGPASRWAAEMHAVGQRVEASLPRRHAQVERVIDTCERIWSPTRAPDLATFPLPHPRPELHVGASSTSLAAIAGRRAHGVNVAWLHPRRDEVLASAREARVAAHGTTDGFSCTTWAPWVDGVLDAEHPQRRAMAAAGIDRLILIPPPQLDASTLAASAPNG